MSAGAPPPTGCESVDGEWGGICPACGQRLPERPGPLRSWMASRPMRPGVRWDGAMLEAGQLVASAAQRARWTPPSTGPGRATRLDLATVLAALRIRAGNVNRASRDMLVAAPSVTSFLRRHADEVPADVRALVAARRRPRRARVAA